MFQFSSSRQPPFGRFWFHKRVDCEIVDPSFYLKHRNRVGWDWFSVLTSIIVDKSPCDAMQLYCLEWIPPTPPHPPTPTLSFACSMQNRTWYCIPWKSVGFGCLFSWLFVLFVFLVQINLLCCCVIALSLGFFLLLLFFFFVPLSFFLHSLSFCLSFLFVFCMCFLSYLSARIFCFGLCLLIDYLFVTVLFISWCYSVHTQGLKRDWITTRLCTYTLCWGDCIAVTHRVWTRAGYLMITHCYLMITHCLFLLLSAFTSLLLSIFFFFFFWHRLVGQVVKASTSRVEDLGFESRLLWNFSGSSHTSDFKIGTSVATLPGTCCYKISPGTGLPCFSILWLGEVETQLLSQCGSM